MKTKELRQRNNEDLKKLLKENQEKLLSLRFDLSARRLKNVKVIKEVKRDIARLFTLINEEKK